MNLQERLKRDHVQNPLPFYSQRDANGWLSNFSPHMVTLRHPFTGHPVIYRTTEHRYQAMKATNAEQHDWVNAAERPSVTKDRGRQVDLRDGWGNDYGDLCWYVMYEALIAKTVQHDEILRALKKTEGMYLYEDSPTDDIWGWRYREDYSGKNLLGQCWMEVRYLTTHQLQP